MASRDHYVSQFHLRGFIDPTSEKSPDPWLWVEECRTGVVKRRSPKKLGWSRDLFGGPGGLSDRGLTLEAFLAREVEGPAAAALRKFEANTRRGPSGIPPALGRYLAWAAARSLPMKTLYQSWIDAAPATAELQFAEPPPAGFGEWRETNRLHRMEHPDHGLRNDVPSDQVELLRSQGWRLCLGKDDFLELVHLQAWYFQVRFFPRLAWLRLRAPTGWNFIIGDRPVIWGFANLFNAVPAYLRHPDVQLVAPLSRSTALFGFQGATGHPEEVLVSDINRITASTAHEWIAGPTEKVVREALAGRVYH